VSVTDLAVRLGIRLYARGATDRRYRAELARRVARDAWTAREVLRTRPAEVTASTIAARRTFAAAKSYGARTTLVLDLPLIRALHRDLDRAAEHWPDRAFLRRFRAPSWAIARQEAERVLADQIVVRGAYARSLCITDGIAPNRITLAPAPLRTITPPARPTGRIRLAGLAAARHGIDTALEACRLAGKTLVARIGDGSEPANLADLIAVDDGPVDAIILPAICEVYAPEIRVTGIPVIASPFAGGSVDPYDPVAFAAALSAA
jgi:hypothetical protein